MSRDDAPQHNQDHQATLAERSIITEGPLGSWFTVQNVIFGLNEVHGNFRRVFFDRFRALLEEPNHEAYVRRMADYVRLIQSKYMFVRVERPYGSKRFVMGYVKCDWVFSFALRFEQMRLRLSCISPVVLMKVEHGENKVLRLGVRGRDGLRAGPGEAPTQWTTSLACGAGGRGRRVGHDLVGRWGRPQ